MAIEEFQRLKNPVPLLPFSFSWMDELNLTSKINEIYSIFKSGIVISLFFEKFLYFKSKIRNIIDK